MQYIFDYQDGYFYAEFANEYDDITPRKAKDIEYLEQFNGKFFFFNQDTFFRWATEWPEKKLSLEHLDKMLATKIYCYENGIWGEITGYFNREINREIERRIQEDPKCRAKLPGNMLLQQLNCVNLEKFVGD